MTRKAFGVTIIAAAVSAAPALAHHAFAMFDQTKLVHMSGTVKQFELVNPHGWLHVVIANDKGEASTWSFEGGSVTQTVVEMVRGFLFVMAISDGSVLAVLASSDCDMGLIGYEMALLVERAGDVLTPALRAELQNSLPR